MNKLSFSAVAMFAEEAREEANGQLTLVGLFSDNMVLPAFGGSILKLLSYVRMAFDASTPPETINVKLLSNGVTVAQSEVDKSFLEESINNTAASGQEIVTIATRFQMINFPITEKTYIDVTMNIGDGEFLVGRMAVTAEQ